MLIGVVSAVSLLLAGAPAPSSPPSPGMFPRKHAVALNTSLGQGTESVLVSLTAGIKGRVYQVSAGF